MGISFNPTDSTQFAVTCISSPKDRIDLFQISSNQMQQTNTYNMNTNGAIGGIKHFPNQGTYALVASFNKYIQVFYISSSQISMQYSLSDSSFLQQIDISPSGNQAAAACNNQFVIYQVSTSSISLAFSLSLAGQYSSCYGVAYYDSTHILLVCQGYGIVQYQINGFSSATYQTIYNAPSIQSAESYITFMSNNYGYGIFPGGASSFYFFSFDSTQNSLTAQLINQASTTEPLSACFSPNNQYVILGASGNIILYTASTIANCQTLVSTYCSACNSGYYLATSTSCLVCANMNSQCVSCSQTSVQCLSCSSGYYLANASTCLVCSTISQCIACSPTSYACTNCSSGYYLATSSTCLLCSTIQNCQTCSQSSKACLSCNTGYYLANSTSCLLCSNITSCLNCTQSTNQCLTCAAGNYLAANSLNCVFCSSITTQCANCSNSSKCNSCNTGYYLASQTSCLPCSNINAQCNACSAVAPTCTACIGTPSVVYSRILPNCICPNAYYSNVSVQADCIACYYKCALCNNGTACLTCINPNLSPPACGCLTGQYQVGMTTNCGNCSYACQSCNSSSISNCTLCYGSSGLQSSRILQSCSCPAIGYWDNFPIQNECQVCANSRCLTCNDSSSNCLTCVGAILQPAPAARALPQCTCAQGYYDNSGDLDCQACAVACLSCVMTASNCVISCAHACVGCITNRSNCLACLGNRLNPPACSCPSHTYDDFVSQNCLSCDDTCVNCTLASGCTLCVANRVNFATNSTNCSCPTTPVAGIYHTSLTYYCTTCDTAVITVNFTSDLTSIVVTFAANISFPGYTKTATNIYSSTFCEYLLDATTQAKLGSSYSCIAPSNSPTTFQISLGRSPSILLNDNVTLNANTIQRSGCAGYSNFTYFYETQVRLPLNSLPPAAVLTGPTAAVSLCQSVGISITQQIYDGYRGLSNFVWSIFSTTASDVTAVTAILTSTNANSGGQNSLTIPMLTLAASSQYTFVVTFQNFVSQKGAATFAITTTTASGAYAQILNSPPLVYKNYVQIEIDASAKFLDCSSGTLVYKSTTLQVVWSDITNSASPIQLQSSTVSSDLASTSYYIQPYSSIPGNTYTIEVNVSAASQTSIYASNSVQYKISVSALIVYINGGNRLQSYSGALTMSGVALDPDVVLANQTVGIAVSWDCLNLNTNGLCESIEGQVIATGSTNTLNYPAKYFEPYNSFMYTFTGVKSSASKSNSAEAVIVVVETDLPLLTVNVPQNMISSTINKNDDLQIEIVYSGNPDDVYFSLIFIYNYDIVATKTFQYTTYAFKIWDLFTNFTADTPQLLLRVSMYDPAYFMPSQSNYQVTINFEPVPGNITVTPLTGTALYTAFTIRLAGFYDEDTPLSYSYIYYIQQQDYLTEKSVGENPTSPLRNTLSDFVSSDAFTTTLPIANYQDTSLQYQMLIMVSVSDSLGAVTNITQTVTIQPASPFSIDTYLAYVTSLYQSAVTQTQVTMAQQLVTLAMDLSRFDSNSAQSCTVSAQCNGKGTCTGTLSTSICTCNSGYYLNDCSADTNQYNTYLTLKQEIYDSLNKLKSQIAQKVIQEQIIKSINQLLSKNDLGLVMSVSDAQQTITDIFSIVKTQQTTIQNLVSQNVLNTGDSTATRTASASNSILGKSISFADQMFGNLVYGAANSARRRGLAYTQSDLNTTMDKIYTLTKNISTAILTATLANSDPIAYTGSQLQQTVQKSTTKTVSAIFTSIPSGVFGGYTPTPDNTTASTSFDSSSSNSTNSTTVYQVNNAVFSDNPLRYDTTFPYQNQSQYMVSIDIKNDADNTSTNINVTKAIPINFQIPSSQNASLQACISQQKDGSWSNKFCSQIVKSSSYTQCSCTQLSAQTVVNDIDGLFTNSKISEVFSAAGLSAFLNFPFYKSYIFYIVCVKTLILIVFVYFGYKKDVKKRQKIIPFLSNVAIVEEAQIPNSVQMLPQSPKKSDSNQPPIFIQQEDPKNKKDSIIQMNQQTLQTLENLKLQKQDKDIVVNNQLEVQPVVNIEPHILKTKTDEQKSIDEPIIKRPRTSRFARKYKNDDHVYDPDEQFMKIGQVNSYTNRYGTNQLQYLNQIASQSEILDKYPNDKKPETKIEGAEEEEQQLKKKQKKLFQGVIKLHQLFGIFLVYDPLISRPSRFVLYYLRIMVMTTLSALFTQYLDQIQSIALSILSTVIISVPLVLFTILLKAENKAVNALGVVLVLSFFLLCFYVCLTSAALMGLDQSNQWAISYMTAYCSDTFMTGPIVMSIKLALARAFIGGQGIFSVIVQKIAGEDVVNYLTG